VAREDFEKRVSSIAALAEPVRRALYRFVSTQPQPVSREEAAAGVGVAHHVAKFNLDKLEEDGLLEVEYSRPPGKAGPGAGRPAKRYRRTARDIEVSLPERHYDLAGRLMAKAIVAAQASGASVGTALRDAAKTAGRELGGKARVRSGASAKGALTAVCTVLEEQGYEPRLSGRTVTLANCPFHALAQEHTELVCGMNLDLLDGLLEGTGRDDLEASLDPAPDRCCVTISGRT
jgi:predicted ArsR family transcriptional regulator